MTFENSFENEARLDYEVGKYRSDTFQRYYGMSDYQQAVFWNDATNAVYALGDKNTQPKPNKLRSTLSDIKRTITGKKSEQFLSRE